MIFKNMSGRLGNQMFQYAMVRKIQEDNSNKDKLILNFKKNVYSKGFKNELKNFNVKEFYEIDNSRIKLNQLIIIYYYRIIKRIIRAIDKKNYYIKRHKLELKIKDKLIKKGIYWMEDGYLESFATSKKNKVVIGRFESSKNFSQIKDKLLVEFTPIYPKLEKNKKMYDLIENTNSVCISIRRGDFVNNKKNALKFNVCDINYFNRAIEKMNSLIDNPTYFIFSDDIDWCKDNIKINNCYYEDGLDPVWEKLRLMYSCKHFIISNSTFSFWAQYLSRNKNKVVIAPKKWQNSGYNDEIYEDNWITIDN
ncbi:MAG: alpha-1,2-fucosyltransferase [Bacilli bacterium]|nr:alpha-1,2-fucosyltransferase [Bacilli bacterium]